ncbi:hypothetical protein GCM10011608_22460 [Micromonospora sonchi]|uniref:Uncharacterized protein n=1 Tax=Micromonospora sonchi TaxID=1763543 RepID=A0A917TVG5_9ACTN|nr:hypothetical protein GCM10011608_22460 [Micromonospora sonchi]
MGEGLWRGSRHDVGLRLELVGLLTLWNAGEASDGFDGNKKARVPDARGQRTLGRESALR